MAKLTAPTLAFGPRKQLSDELHALHRRAGWPSVRELARALGTGVASSSRIHDAFTKPRMPDWGLLEVLVIELAGRAPDTDVAAEAKRFHGLWDSAAVAEDAPENEPEVKPVERAQPEPDWGAVFKWMQSLANKPETTEGDDGADALSSDRVNNTALPSAEEEKQAIILRAMGEAKAAVIRAEGDAAAWRTRKEAYDALKDPEDFHRDA